MVSLNLRQKAGVVLVVVGLVLAFWSTVLLIAGHGGGSFTYIGAILTVFATAVFLLAPRYLIADDPTIK